MKKELLKISEPIEVEFTEIPKTEKSPRPEISKISLMDKFKSFFKDLFSRKQKVIVNSTQRKKRTISVRVFHSPARRRGDRKQNQKKIDFKSIKPFVLPILLAVLSCLDTVLFFNKQFGWATGGTIGIVVGLVTYFLIRYWKNNWQEILHWALAVLIGLSVTLFWTDDLMELLSFPWAIVMAIGFFLLTGFVKSVVSFVRMVLTKVDEKIIQQVIEKLEDISDKLKKIDWRQVGHISFCLTMGILSALYWLDTNLLWWQVTLGSLQAMSIALLIYFRKSVHEWLVTDKHWLLIGLIILSLALTVSGYLIWSWEIFYAILFGAILIALSLVIYINREKLLAYVKNHGKKIVGYGLISLIVLANVIMFGHYILDFILNNIGWTIGGLGLLIVLILIVSNWDKIKEWPIWEQLLEFVRNSGYKTITVTITVLAILILVFGKNFQHFWMLMLIALIFFRLNNVYQKRTKATPENEGSQVSPLQDIKLAFNYGFWLLGFIFLSGFWIIIYAM